MNHYKLFKYQKNKYLIHIMEDQRTITPSVWGPHGWKFLHYVTLGYPMDPTNQDKQNYKQFFDNLANVLPCVKCSENFKDNLKNYPIGPSLENRDLLIRWLIDIHNSVNDELNKPNVDYETAIQLYLEDGETSTSEYIFKVIVLISLLFFIYYFFKK